MFDGLAVGDLVAVEAAVCEGDGVDDTVGRAVALGLIDGDGVGTAVSVEVADGVMVAASMNVTSGETYD